MIVFMMLSSQCSTKYAWVIDADLILGSSYLHLLLHTINTPQYTHTILGASGYILPVPLPGLTSNTKPSWSHPVNFLGKGQYQGQFDDISASGMSSSDQNLLHYPDVDNGVFADSVLEVDFLSGMWFMETEVVKYFLSEVNRVVYVCLVWWIVMDLVC
jgi:hypothetical protein